MAIVHYQLDDGVGANVKITPHLLFREGFKVAGDDLLLDIIQRCVLPSLQTALQRAGVTDAAALLATLFGDSGRIDTQAILRQQTALQLFMPLGHAVLSAREQSDINDPFAGLHATFGDLLIRRPTSNVMNYIQQAIDHALPSGSPTFDIFNVPLQIQFSQLQEALLAGQFTLTTPLHAVCEAISHYHCDILLVTGDRPVYPAYRRSSGTYNRCRLIALCGWISIRYMNGIPSVSKGVSAIQNPLLRWARCYAARRWTYVCRVSILKRLISARIRLCVISAYWIIPLIPFAMRISGITRSIWINPAQRWTHACIFATRQRDVGLPSTGEQSLACNPTLLPEH